MLTEKAQIVRSKTLLHVQAPQLTDFSIDFLSLSQGWLQAQHSDGRVMELPARSRKVSDQVHQKALSE